MTTATVSNNKELTVDQLKAFFESRSTVLARIKETVNSIAMALLSPLFALYTIIFGTETQRFASFNARVIKTLDGMDKASEEFKKAFGDHKAILVSRSENLEKLIDSDTKNLKILKRTLKTTVTDSAVQKRVMKAIASTESAIEANTAKLTSVGEMKTELKNIAPKSVWNLWGRV